MKNNARGISVLALVITIIVIVIITSITTYTGINMVSDARKKDATDKLKTICNSIRREDTILGMESGEVILVEQDYINLDLKDFYDEKHPVYVRKEIVSDLEKIESIYTLEMHKDETSSEVYVAESFSIVKPLEKGIYNASFDEVKMVNRPILYDGMLPLTADEKSIVEDVYVDNWYNYNSSSPTFAKMRLDSNNNGVLDDTDDKTVYVWIPRFAYTIQSYYDGYDNPEQSFPLVPNVALQITFLREGTRNMPNKEVIPSGYMVHPAFTHIINSEEKFELPGFWVAVNSSESKGSISTAISNSASVVNSISSSLKNLMSSHLMTNSECSAVLYLLFSTNNLDVIDLFEADEYVAGGYKSATGIKDLEYVDLYEADASSFTGIKNKRGDGMVETNWGRLEAVYPTSSKPYIVRRLTSGVFDFISVASGSYNYRAVIVPKSE